LVGHLIHLIINSFKMFAVSSTTEKSYSQNSNFYHRRVGEDPSSPRATERGGAAARAADPGANPCSACSTITLRLLDTPLALAEQSLALARRCSSLHPGLPWRHPCLACFRHKSPI
jgi:hypothetical protein